MQRKVDPIFILFFLSGFSGLIYESVWSHYVKLFLGHAAYAQTLVLVVFIGGLALGSWICARMAERLRNPLRIYAAIELTIGILALVFHEVFVRAVDWGYASLLPATCEQASTFCVAQWGLAAALLLPQSILLGATFPLVSSAVLRLEGKQPGHDIATLYFLNSLGAVLGVLASAFVLIPASGLPGTLLIAGVVNVAVAIAAYALSKVAPPPLAVGLVAPGLQHESAAPERARTLTRVLLATAFLTGLSSFIYEIAWIRMLSLVLGASTHAFELMLASFILGLALGGFWVRNRVDSTDDAVRFLALVQLAMGAAAAATIPVYGASFDLMAWLLSSLSRSDGGFVLFNLSSSLIALAVMLPATVCAGMTLPLITYRLLRSAEGERSLGMVYAVNTLGAIVGVTIAVHLLMENLGVRGALLVGAAIDLALGITLLAWLSPMRWSVALRPSVIASVAVAVAVAAVFPMDLRKTASGVYRSGAAAIPPNQAVIFHRDGKTATVDVLESVGGSRSIRTNGKSDAAIMMRAGTPPAPDEYTMTLLAMLPLGHRPEAKRAAVIGFGSGMSTAMLLASPALERVDTIEIEPAMVEGARHFQPVVDAAFNDPRSKIVIDDAKSYFARGRNRYDIIVSEPSNPWVSGVATLFTEEFYQRLAEYLNEGGVLSQWLQTYGMDTQTLASILNALSKTFPDFLIYTSIDSDIVIIARKGAGPGQFDQRAMQFDPLKPMLDRLNMTDVATVNRRLVGRWSTLRPFVESYSTAVNSDFFPIVDQRASKTRFTQAQVGELVALQTMSIPLLPMLEGRAEPSRVRHRAPSTTIVDAASARAWDLSDSVLGSEGMPSPETNALENAARYVRLWSTGCPREQTFEHALPAMVALAEVTSPFLHPEPGARLWNWVAESPCGRKLAAPERRWLELFVAVAQRDSARMRDIGQAILQAQPPGPNSLTEYAFLATMTGMVCAGDRAGARKYLEKGARSWVRSGARRTEIRFLDVLTASQQDGGGPSQTCAAAKAG
jgi:spermidine synthase